MGSPSGSPWQESSRWMTAVHGHDHRKEWMQAEAWGSVDWMQACEGEERARMVPDTHVGDGWRAVLVKDQRMKEEGPNPGEVGLFKI